MAQIVTNKIRPGALLVLFAAAILAAGLLGLAGAKPVWAEVRSFAPAPNSPVPVGSTPTTVTSADFNDDGNVDLAAQNAGSNTVSVRLGNGDGTFQPKQDFAVGSAPTSVIGADLNTDGVADLAVANQNSHSVSVLLGEDLDGDGKGDGTFQAAQAFPIAPPCSGDLCPLETVAAPNQVITSDFNGDTKADLATANFGACGPLGVCNPGGVSVLLGNGDGTFQTPKIPKKGTPITSITGMHLDAGTSMDLVATEFNNHAVSVLRGNGDGTFQAAAQSLRVGSNPSAVASADLDGDARADDLAVSNLDSNDVSVLFSNDAGGFQAARNFLAGDGPIFVTSARFDGDGFADLAVANQNSNNVSVLLNTAPPPPPPETTITEGPSGTVNSATATFEFTSSEPGSTFQCALNDPSTFAPCTSPTTVPEQGLLADGTHTFYVKATGAAGNNTDLTPATRTWTVDTAAPAPPAITSPPGAGRVGANFTVSGTAEAGSTVELFEGSASRGTARANASEQWSTNLTGVSDGPHTYTARARDAAGNTSADSEARTVTVDATAPTAPSITSPAEGSFDTDGSFTVSGTAEASSTVRLSEGTVSKGTATADGTGNWSIGLAGVADGSHTYRARATDAAGNASGFSNARTVTVDTTVPTVTARSPQPNAIGISPTANVTATFSEAMTRSSLDGTTVRLVRTGTTRAVGASLTYPAPSRVVLNPTNPLVRGATYRVTIAGGTGGAKDLAGNALAANASWTFKVRTQ